MKDLVARNALRFAVKRAVGMMVFFMWSGTRNILIDGFYGVASLLVLEECLINMPLLT